MGQPKEARWGSTGREEEKQGHRERRTRLKRRRTREMGQRYFLLKKPNHIKNEYTNDKTKRRK
jgi:hypothetical protein